MSDLSLRGIFVNNRAEQLPSDIWNEFVIPMHFKKIDLGYDRKSVLIEGGRGCGKTMFIRYYCHNTIFSSYRRKIPDKEISNVGIYWKPHVKYCAFIEKPTWIPEEFKERAFQHRAALEILDDFCNSLESIEKADLENGPISIMNEKIPPVASIYFGNKIETYGEIKKYVSLENAKLDIWSKNPQLERPIFIQFDQILEILSESLAKTNPRLEKLFFRVFIDEYENLQERQQRLLNDHIKHPGKRFCLNIATRRNSRFCTETSGFECIVEIHDYRRVDLESEFLEQNSSFSLLAAEVLLLKLNQAGFKLNNAPDLSVLRDRSRLEERQKKDYQSKIKQIARNIFPKLTASEIAEIVFAEEALSNRLKKLIEKGLKKHRMENDLHVDSFLVKSTPEASIVSACMLNRDRIDPRQVLVELVNLKENKPSKFSPESEWIKENLYGALFYLYSGLPKRPCLLYSGFDRFCQIARSNLRFFQELCHESFTIFESDYSDKINPGLVFSIPCVVQAEAAKITSEKVLINIANFGTELLHLIRRLGKLFQLSQKRAGQSEPEVNHFTISGRLPPAEQEKIDYILVKARTWSVLYEDKDTKNKRAENTESVDYIPNPIFTPYFGISYRKKRKLTFTAQEFLEILEGNDENFQKIQGRYEQKWDIPTKIVQQEMF